MKPAELSRTCELCGHQTRYADSIPDAAVAGYPHASSCGYRMQALCFRHGLERLEVATSRVEVATAFEGWAVARIYRGVPEEVGEVVCHDCGRTYKDHPADPDTVGMTRLCDGSFML